jgi:hypothetical protein
VIEEIDCPREINYLTPAPFPTILLAIQVGG